MKNTDKDQLSCARSNALHLSYSNAHLEMQPKASKTCVITM